MVLFKPEHVPMILSGRKVHTRRIWKSCHVKGGHVYQARTKLFDKSSVFARLIVVGLWQERLLDISEGDAFKEGYNSRYEFLEVFKRINKGKPIPEDLVVYVIEFRLA